MDEFYGAVNAHHVHYYRSPQMFREHTLPYYYAVANDMVLGPGDLFVIRNAGGKQEHFERIIQILSRVPNTAITSWSIFARERTWRRRTAGRGRRFVLRHSTWDTKADMAARAWMQRALPTLSTISWYIEEKHCDQLLQCGKQLDTLLVQGIPFQRRGHTQVVWKELSVSRLLDWGAIELTWHQSRENRALEQAVFALTAAIEQMLPQQKATAQIHVDSLEMVFPGGAYLPGLCPELGVPEAPGGQRT